MKRLNFKLKEVTFTLKKVWIFPHDDMQAYPKCPKTLTLDYYCRFFIVEYSLFSTLYCRLFIVDSSLSFLYCRFLYCRLLYCQLLYCRLLYCRLYLLVQKFQNTKFLTIRVDQKGSTIRVDNKSRQ